jgi:exodeoxyribonuclease VII large subunit
MSADKIYTLSKVAESIRHTLANRYGSTFWVKAEMNKLNYYSHSGHCYPELVEKVGGKVVAQMKSTLWQADYQRINKKFLEVLKEPVRDGIKILFQAKVTFDAIHGLSLHISDIDPSYTLGDLELEKKETIERLKKEGLFERNRQLPMPLLPQRIALISVETSKGYADFLEVLKTNPSGYRFFHMLFPALLQGEKAIDSIMAQLRVIRKVIHHFDVVCIIRGGGGDVGLSCYNNYHLAREVANFPIPVLTGIGHATNETVTEMVSYRNGITPTRVAEDLIRQFNLFAQPVDQARQIILSAAGNIISDTNKQLQFEGRLFRKSTESLISRNSQLVMNNRQKIITAAQYYIMQQHRNIGFQGTMAGKSTRVMILSDHQKIDNLAKLLSKDCMNMLSKQEERVKRLESDTYNMSPQRVLQRGYSISMTEGRLVRSIEEIKPGEELHTLLADGEIKSRIESTIKNE